MGFEEVTLIELGNTPDDEYSENLSTSITRLLFEVLLTFLLCIELFENFVEHCKATIFLASKCFCFCERLTTEGGSINLFLLLLKFLMNFVESLFKNSSDL